MNFKLLDFLARRRLVLVAGASVIVLTSVALMGYSADPSSPVKAQAPAPDEVDETLVPIPREPAPALAAAVASQPSSLDVLRNSIAAALEASTAGTRSATVWIARSGTAFDINSDRALPPASIQKVFVASSALRLLGPEYTYTTRVLRTGELRPDGTLEGDIVLVGGGDPSLTRGDLQNFASSMIAAGVRSISGSVIGNEDRYDKVRNAPGWKPNYVTHESGTLSALAVDGNSYRNDPGFTAEPALANAELFREILVTSGVNVAGGAAVNASPLETTQDLVVKTSPPMRELVTHMLQESDNFYAELILKELGHSMGSPSTGGGIERIRQFASTQGLPFGTSFDGSGLSSENRQTGATLMRWLEWIDTPSAEMGLEQMLPASCAPTGTLKRRMCGSVAAGKVFAKSGGLPHIATLAGYTETVRGRRVRFAFVLTDAVSTKSARLAIDNALIAIASFEG